MVNLTAPPVRGASGKEGVSLNPRVLVEAEGDDIEAELLLPTLELPKPGVLPDDEVNGIPGNGGTVVEVKDEAEDDEVDEDDDDIINPLLSSAIPSNGGD